MAGFDRYADHSTASRLDDVAADDGVGGPVRAFHEHVGLKRRNQRRTASPHRISRRRRRMPARRESLPARPAA